MTKEEAQDHILVYFIEDIKEICTPITPFKKGETYNDLEPKSPKTIDELVQSDNEYTLNGIRVNIQIPFIDCGCSNWYDHPNDYVGIIYKGEKVTYIQLKTILDIAKGFYKNLSPLTTAELKFDGKDLNLYELERIFAKIESYKKYNEWRNQMKFPENIKILIL